MQGIFPPLNFQGRGDHVRTYIRPVLPSLVNVVGNKWCNPEGTTQNFKDRAPQTPSNTRGKHWFSGDYSTSDTRHATLVIKAVMGHEVGTDGEVPTTSINMNLISNSHGSLEDKYLQIIILEYGAK